MARNGTRSNFHMNALGVVSLLLMIQQGVSTQFTVGGKNGWTVPSDSSAIYNQWAEKSRFQVGDSLVFNYQSGSDSVLLVKKEDYDSCNTGSPIHKYTDGHTVIQFSKSGPHYFISGNKDNCQKNEKLVVVVLADRSKKRTDTAPTASPPSPATPAPAPVGEASPPSPSVPASPAPSTESPNTKNSASSTLLSIVGTVGAFLGSSIILAF